MKTKTLALTALFISLAAIGGLLKIPVGIASIALDSMPALIAALFLSAPLAGTVAAAGHLLSAMLGGFPLGPFHFLIAFEMFAVVWLFAKMSEHRWNKLRWPAFVIGNGIIAAIPFYFLLSPHFSMLLFQDSCLRQRLTPALPQSLCPSCSELARR
ncbi:ECF transporter S component [Planococcus sp. 107-1]|uniref:ECF transporter S component n=1 Tax=Planococcus sp. 107-1 TaxID=2908840 RepID=UPI001F253C8C|nr:ECF transporter S component [Planococcus sp. 107-1]UJF26292.1 ECF transporter S component [Planococcus sp. 107-1]